mgnify:CR=1 FL=1
MTTTLNGIPNCDTVKKARKWLEAQGIVDLSRPADGDTWV